MAAADARIRVRLLDSVDELESVRRLYESIWQTGTTNPPVTADMLRALSKAGGYVSGAYAGEDLVGACFGFFSAPDREALHSHIAGVVGGSRARHVGFALKLHQRAWVLDSGAAAITWTYDPLIRRNAWFNLGKLAADVVEYLPDFYGPLDDDINRTDPTDRVLIRWDLRAQAVADACSGRARHDHFPGTDRDTILAESVAGGPILRAPVGCVVRVGVPADIEQLRERDPVCAAEWRAALREVLGGLLADGARIRGFDRSGWYVVERNSR